MATENSSNFAEEAARYAVLDAGLMYQSIYPDGPEVVDYRQFENIELFDDTESAPWE